MSKSVTAYKDAIEKLLKSGEDPHFVALLKQLADAIPPDETASIPPKDVYAYARSLWEFAARRPTDTALLRILHPRLQKLSWSAPHTVIEIINDDMPFLVDSITAEINRLGYSVYLILHPIVPLPRSASGNIEAKASPKPESIMHIKINEFIPPEDLPLLEQNILAVIEDVRAAVQDWPAMLAALKAAHEALPGDHPEEYDFLQWLQQNHFTFLGYRIINFGSKGRKAGTMVVEPDSGLGILRAAERPVFAGIRNLNDLPEAFVSFLHSSAPLLLSKTTRPATVHRAVPMDCLDIKRYDTSGAVIGLHRFVGLFTSNTYSDSALSIPLVRRKIQHVLKQADFDPRGHNGKALMHILESFPRDELYQITEDDLLTISLGILHLQERQRVALFHRMAPSSRSVSCFVFIPRDKYTLTVRQKVQAILETGFRAVVKSAHVHVADDPLARLYFVLETETLATSFDNAAIERQLREACHSWEEQLKSKLHTDRGVADASVLYARYGKAFPLAYQEQFPHGHAAQDIQALESLYKDETIKLRLFALDSSLPHFFGLKIHALDNPLPLSDILPVLENLGLHVMSETSYHIKPGHSQTAAWIHYFEVSTKNRQSVDLAAAEHHLQDAVHHIWTKICEDDRLNQLLLTAGVNWREITILRAYAAYMKQIKFSYDHDAVVAAFVQYPIIAKTLIAFFLKRFYPLDNPTRESELLAARADLDEQLNRVESLADDRILRRCLDLMQATLRTNYFQEQTLYAPRPYLSLKFDGDSIPELPLPRPYREIFVYSPYLEAVHLRAGKVARGGIRWSDRKEDFRTEILGLMKAQRVKNAVIVPSGAKGGFIVKTPLDRSYPEQVQREVERCYRLMIASLLEITDSVTGTECRRPEGVFCHDDEDPYLVVAADKGTATFSDIANSIAEEKGFWLGDAFASGGSAGYDHKKMGITARGAWEAVKRHFRELGKDIQKQDFTVIGVGDMAGDVFGNGMLLSRHIKLIAAFNHQHIFLDPNPDPHRSFEERHRLFQLPRSTWKDYDTRILSPGGGVYSRSEKAITLTPEVQALLGITDKTLTPAALIQLLLKHPTELLWFGGIGTFVRSTRESNDNVADKANDVLRITAAELRAKVIGEGANLGMTQAARIEYALAGGRLNTDAIDNSGGVDCSDHEVNIKIVLNPLMQQGDLPRPQRDALLVAMTDSVASLVLRNNYLQTQALSMMQQDGVASLLAQQRLIRSLESRRLLDRTLEHLPSDTEIQERLAMRTGLTRPELAVLMAYAKLDLTEQLIHSKLPAEERLQDELRRYFPQALQERYDSSLRQHRLGREIIATATANSLINRMGATFIHDTAVMTGAAVCDIVRCYTVIRDSVGIRDDWHRLEGLDASLDAAKQLNCLSVIRRFMQHGVLFLLFNYQHPINVTALIEELQPQFTTLRRFFGDRLQIPQESDSVSSLSRSIMIYPELIVGLDSIDISRRSHSPLQLVTETYLALQECLSLTNLTQYAEGIAVTAPIQEQALWSLRFDILRTINRLCEQSLRQGAGNCPKAMEDWLQDKAGGIHHTIRRCLQEAQTAGIHDLSVLLVINRLLAQAILISQ